MIDLRDIPPNVLQRARQLTRAATDEEAVARAVAVFVREHSPASAIDWENGDPNEVLPITDGDGRYLTRAELSEFRTRQRNAIALLGTFESLASDEEFEIIRGRKPADE